MTNAIKPYNKIHIAILLTIVNNYHTYELTQYLQKLIKSLVYFILLKLGIFFIIKIFLIVLILILILATIILAYQNLNLQLLRLRIKLLILIYQM